ncbi:MAG: PASTA domain-containing protein, partial [Blautia sp.]|nr:PASTA domain-containing protein [Blautia sp.]
MTEEEATAKANESRLGLLYGGEEPSALTKGLVSRQEIAAGEMVDAYTSIRYYISVGSTSLTIPYVDGQTGIDAKASLESAGLKVNIERIYSALDENGYPVIDPGYAYYTEPSGGESANVGDTVTLYVSRGVDYGDWAEVPDVVGLQRDAALTSLGKFLNIEVREQTSDEVADGEVISQNPAGYNYVDPDYDTIVITVSTGSRDTTGALSAQETINQDPAVAAATAAGEVWKCTQRLNTPGGYHGGLIRLELEQQAAGQSVTTMVVDGEMLSFPYQLDLTGVPGLSVGYVHLYEQVDGGYTQLGTYTLEFSRVN